MHLFLISGAAALVGLAAPASAQYYAPRPTYAPARANPTLPPSYDRGAWVREGRAYLRERRRRGETGGVVGGLIGGAGGALLGLGNLLRAQPGRDDARAADAVTEDVLRLLGMTAEDARAVCERPLPDVTTVESASP